MRVNHKRIRQCVSVLAAMLLAVCWCPCQATAQDESKVTADDVIDNHLEALGGAMALEVGSLKAAGEFRADIEGAEPAGLDGDWSGDVFVYYKDGTFVMEFVMGGGRKSTVGYDGLDCWNRKSESDKVLKANPDESGWPQALPFLSQQPIHWRQWDIEITKLADTTFDDQPVHQLQFLFGEETTVRHYFHKESGLLIGSNTEMVEQDIVLRYEYKEVEQLQCIKKIAIMYKVSDMKTKYVYKFNEFDFEPRIPEEIFKRPDK